MPMNRHPHKRNDEEAQEMLAEAQVWLYSARDALIHGEGKEEIRRAIIFGNRALDTASSGQLCNKVVQLLSVAVRLEEAIAMGTTRKYQTGAIRKRRRY